MQSMSHLLEELEAHLISDEYKRELEEMRQSGLGEPNSILDLLSIMLNQAVRIHEQNPQDHDAACAFMDDIRSLKSNIKHLKLLLIPRYINPSSFTDEMNANSLKEIKDIADILNSEVCKRTSEGIRKIQQKYYDIESTDKE